jgi:DNA-binding Lrp family transcriptional regulator
MTVRAYVFIQTDVGVAADVTVEVRRLPGVSSADGVTGPYDVIACVEVDTIDALGQMVVSRVQMIDGITRTMTCPVVTL